MQSKHNRVEDPRESDHSTWGGKRARLRILTDIDGDIDDTSTVESNEGLESAVDSLFDEPNELTKSRNHAARTWRERLHSPPLDDVNPASRKSPLIPGLFTPSVRLPPELADGVMQTCMDKYFRNGRINQVMLFGSAHPAPANSSSQSGIPPFLTELLFAISELLLPELPAHTHALLFPPPSTPSRARQAILNLYYPGEGISPHVDLLTRFGDGIVGISLGSGCVMSFRKELGQKEHQGAPSVHAGDVHGMLDEEHLYLPERSIVVLSEEARYKWTHGIRGRTKDFVRRDDDGEGEWIPRGVRLSITFRWLLPGADIIGGPD